MDYSGQNINNWFVIRKLDERRAQNGSIVYECQCECGRIIIKTPNEMKLVSRCKTCAKRQYIGSLSKEFYSKIKRHANIRGISFDVTQQFLWDLYVKQNGKCALTGLDINFADSSIDHRRGKTSASLDRIDNDRGYDEDNVWWIHKTVNFLKHILFLGELIFLCRLIVKKFQNYKVPQSVLDKYNYKEEGETSHDN